MSLAFTYPQALWLLLLVPLTAGLALAGPRRPTPARFWGTLALRTLLLTAIVLALAGTQLRLPSNLLTVVFLVDASDSIPAEERARAEALVRQAVAEMPPGDRTAVVVFGKNALVERLASEERSLPDLASVPVTARTDIAGALQLGLALFPDEGARRMVLLSDGRENVGHAVEQAELAAAHGVELTYLPLRGPEGAAEVLLEALDAPAAVRQGQTFDLAILVTSSAGVDASLQVFADERLVHSESVRLQPGENRFRIPVESPTPGFHRYRAQIVPDADTRLQNNQASAFTVVHGPPRILLVEGQPEEGEPATAPAHPGEALAEALRAAQMDVSVVSPAALPTTLAELAAFDTVVLVDVPADALPAGAMEALPVYVRDLGRGLLMVGGPHAYGAGGYLRTPLEEALPVYMDVRDKEQNPNLALVLSVDKSGSMGRCHCDDPDLTQSYERREVGQPKVDIAKEAVMRAAMALGEQDYLGVVAFDSTARWALEVQPLTDLASLESAVGGIQAAGQTNLQAGVQAAYEALQATPARKKHIVLLTDGWVRTGDISALARELRDRGITLSVVAAGGGSAQYLAELAQLGGGRYYPAVDILQVPDFFFKETVTAVGQYIIEKPFFPLPGAPSPVLQGLNPAALPPLGGYNGTTPKNTARVDLGTPRGDPLLATWQYGLGRAAAWTSDFKGQWATAWLTWEGFPRFAAQLVSWTLPTPQVEGLSAQATLEEDRAVIRLEALDQAGRPRNFLEAVAVLIGPDLERQELTLEQVGAGLYQAQTDLERPGTYLIRLGVNEGDNTLGQQTLGLVVPYSPEYRESGPDRTLLGELARLTGGDKLRDPSAAFAHNLPAAFRSREIWTSLLWLVALLFPLDVALRRVMLGRSELRKAGDWLRARLPSRAPRQTGGARALGRLFQARDRARHRRSAAESPPSTPPPEGPPSEGIAPPEPVPPAVSAEDTLARLREAKKRARR